MNQSTLIIIALIISQNIGFPDQFSWLKLPISPPIREINNALLPICYEVQARNWVQLEMRVNAFRL